MSKALDFIEQDIGKTKGQGLKALGLGLLVLAFSAGSSLALRPDFEDLDAFYVTQCAILGAVLVSFIALYLSPSLSEKQKRFLWQGAVISSLVLSLAHEGLHGFSRNASLVRFWKDAAFCFTQGVIVGLISGTILTLGAFRFLPMPDRRWQLGLAAASALGGLTALNLGCPSAVATHIVIGHWAQGLLVTAIVVRWQAALFKREMRRVLGAGAESGAVDVLSD
jgi:hypothetical protein